MRLRSLLSAGPGGLLAYFLSALLAVQVAVAFLPMPGGNGDGAAGFEIVICSTDGTRTITLSPDGEETDDSEIPNGHCPLCIVSVDVADCTFEPVAVHAIASKLHYGYAATPQTLGHSGDRFDAIRAPPFG